ncbi:MAG: hypothetical protein DHS20C16_25200 [Phycisphaerae bacterium]|nr:MAG: hypothetical protein DHS20C16_25200 [Phycisphaerae bacterium]
MAGCEVDLMALIGRGGNQDGGGDPTPAGKRLIRFESADELGDYFVEQSKNSQSRGGDFFFDEDLALGGDGADAAPAPTANGGDDAGGSNNSLQEGGETANPQDASGTGDNGGDFSTTTEQEAGVQEADVIKNDGEYLYVLSRGNLRIVKATPVEEMGEMGSVDLRGYGFDMYLVGDKVVAITTPEFEGVPVDTFPADDGPVGSATDAPAPEPADPKPIETALVAAEFYYQPRVQITVIDVADRANPQVLSRTELDGNINASRMIDNRLYLVMVHYPDFLPLIAESVDARNPIGGGVSDVIPNIKVDVDGVNVVDGDIAEPTDFYRPVDQDGWGLTTVVSFDIDTPTDYQAQSVVGYPSNAYMSTEALYLTNTDYDFEGKMRETTDIYKFAVVEDGTELAATGSVPGRVLNQYSMGEHNGFLRLASTVGPTFNRLGQNTSESKNNVYVLEQVEDTLTVAGSVEGLAPGESIQSARFLGDRGFVVTFVQIDPLFTLDLSDPRDPKVVGELKVPGFSTFITPMGENHLLTIGRDTNDDFGFVRADGVRLSIFDVTDFANPQLAHSETIGSGGAYSEALFNPKAFTYFEQRNLLAFPVEIYGFNENIDFADDGDFAGGGGSDGDVDPGDVELEDGDEPLGDNTPVTDLPTETQGSPGNEGETSGGGASSGGSPGMATDPAIEPNPPGDEPTGDDEVPVDFIDLPPVPSDFFYGVYVYEVTPEGGFASRGRISTAPEDGYYYGAAFSRGAFIGDYIYATTSEGVKAALVTNVEEVVSKVDFPKPEFNNGPVGGFEDDVVVNGSEPEASPE